MIIKQQHSLIYCLIFFLLYQSSVVARVGCASHLYPSSLGVKQGYLFTSLAQRCQQVVSDIDVLILDGALYKNWILESDYLLDQFLDIYTFIRCILIDTHASSFYLADDAEFIIDKVNIIKQRYESLLLHAPEHEHIKLILVFLSVLLHKIVLQASSLRHLTKEVLLDQHVVICHYKLSKLPYTYKTKTANA